MMLLSLAAAVVSVVTLGLIAWRDPKRLRAATAAGVVRRAQPLSPKARRALAILVLLPGVALALAGESAAFMIWMGAVLPLGWLLVQLLATPSRARRSRKSAVHPE